jgi:hypothetical protein
LNQRKKINKKNVFHYVSEAKKSGSNTFFFVFFSIFLVFYPFFDLVLFIFSTQFFYIFAVIRIVNILLEKTSYKISIPMKIAKHISPIIFLITLVNVIYCQNVTKNERIIWNNIPDSISIFYPLFSNSSYNSDYNTAMHIGKYFLPNKSYNVIFSGLVCDNITPQEQRYLEANEALLSDSVL